MLMLQRAEQVDLALAREWGGWGERESERERERERQGERAKDRDCETGGEREARSETARARKWKEAHATQPARVSP